MPENIVDDAPLYSTWEERRGVKDGAANRDLRAAIVVSLPPVAAATAWSLHHFLPDRQLLPLNWLEDVPDWQHPYPVLLLILLVVSTLFAAGQWCWRPLRPWVRYYAPLATGWIVLFAAWDLLTLKLNYLELPYFPGPDTVLAGMVDDRAILLKSAWHSLLLLSAGYATGAAAGLTTGVLIGWFSRLRYWGMPVMKLVGPVPATALVALVMKLSSEPFVCGVALIAFAVWFPVTMLTASGIANVRISYLDVARTLGAGRLYLIFRVAIPAALPTIFLGLFMGLGASFLTLSVAETVGVKAGLGTYIKLEQGYMEYAKVYGVLIIMAAFFSGLMTLLFKVRDWALSWQTGVIRW